MSIITTCLARATVALVALSCQLAANAALVPFEAIVDGESLIVDVLDPAGPVVQVRTAATGSGAWGALSYTSADTIDLGTGRGRGSNRFLFASGNALFGDFEVQMLPGEDAAHFLLTGLVGITGGTGAFAGASGEARFTGSGVFVEATRALTHFAFTGTVSTVPEPASGWLLLAGCAALAAVARSGRGQPRPVPLHLLPHLRGRGAADHVAGVE